MTPGIGFWREELLQQRSEIFGLSYCKVEMEQHSKEAGALFNIDSDKNVELGYN
jgi:hypothetical protein